jgi:hypothetical protein
MSIDAAYRKIPGVDFVGIDRTFQYWADCSSLHTASDFSVDLKHFALDTITFFSPPKLLKFDRRNAQRAGAVGS